MSYDKSLLEVWEWREKVRQETKDLSPEEYVKKVRKEVDDFLSENNINLEKISQRDIIIKKTAKK